LCSQYRFSPLALEAPRPIMIASRGTGDVERAGRFHFAFNALNCASPDLEILRYGQHTLFGSQLSLYTLLRGGIDLGPPKLLTALNGPL
jgi:hypothetical protein